MDKPQEKLIFMHKVVCMEVLFLGLTVVYFINNLLCDSSARKAKMFRLNLKALLLSFFIMLSFTGNTQRLMENLGRGVVAIRTSASEVFISWRLLGTDPDGTSFNLYRDNTKINSVPIIGATNYIDNS